MNKLKSGIKAFAKGLGEFFAPRDWIPTIPLPPVGKREPKGDGCMSLWDAIRGFDHERK